MDFKFKNFVPAILGMLGLSSFSKAEDGSECLTAEEADKLRMYGFPEKFIAALNAYLKNPDDAEEANGDNKQMAVVAAMLGQTTSALEEAQAEVSRLTQATLAGKQDHAAAIREKEAEISRLREQVNILSAQAEEDTLPTALKTPATAPVALDLNDEQQLGGMPGEYFKLDRAYNRRALAAMLAAQGVEMRVKAETKGDFKRLQDDLGAFYATPWDQRIRSFLVKLPSITSIFPTESGHHDLEILVNIWLGEFSQAGNTVGSEFDKVAKGSYEFDHETLRIYDVMFVHRFKDLKVLEKSWIAYLNREGSSSLKLSFIEFILVKVAEKLHNEREQRWVNGVRKNPNPNEPGRALQAADGVYEYLRKKIEGFVDFTLSSATAGKTVYQIKPFDLPPITQANIGEVFYRGTEMIPAEFRDTGSIVLHVPSYMIPWYIKYNETMYGQNTDYAKDASVVHEFPAVRIKAIPNADNHRRIFWTIDGNIKTYDKVAGEMLRFELEQEDWSLKVWSEWGEGIAAEAVGYKYTDKRDMDGSRQVIWCNNEDRPASYFIESEAGAQPSVLLHSSVVTSAANTSPLAITDIQDAEVGKAVIVKAGTDDVTIAKSGKFDLITAAWQPKKGDTITLMKREDGKFIEIARATSALGAYMFEPDATTPDVSGASTFVCGENTKATAITDLTNAVVGEIYTIHGNGTANASTIANGGNFVLTKAMTLSAGTYIKLVKSENGKISEVARG